MGGGGCFFRWCCCVDPAVSLVRRQWIMVLVDAAAAATTALWIQLAMPYEHQPAYFWVPVAAGLIAALARLVVWPIMAYRRKMVVPEP